MFIENEPSEIEHLTYAKIPLDPSKVKDRAGSPSKGDLTNRRSRCSFVVRVRGTLRDLRRRQRREQVLLQPYSSSNHNQTEPFGPPNVRLPAQDEGMA